MCTVQVYIQCIQNLFRYCFKQYAGAVDYLSDCISVHMDYLSLYVTDV